MDRSTRWLAAMLILGVGVIHLEQYFDFMIKDAATIGELFLLNAAGAGAISMILASRFVLAGALAGIGLSLGSLISIVISRYVGGGLFDYTEMSWRTPIIIAVALEVAAIVVLAGAVLTQRRSRA